MRQAGREARIALDGAGEHLTVRGYRGILSYTAEEMRLRLRGTTLCVEGAELTLEEMDEEDLFISGRIRCVRLED